MRRIFLLCSLFSVLLITLLSLVLSLKFLYVFVILLPVLLLGFYDMFQKHHAIMRNYPILGRLRYLMEEIRPKVYQYFVESDTDGRPINRNERSTIYQRAKKDNDTTPFGTQLDVYNEGYEWLAHSIAPIDPRILNFDPRILVGGSDCRVPFSASILNVSAMSFGAISKNAVLALNGGAKIGNFAQNTGEGGISPYHLELGGDIIWQVGTGYFGCRDEKGNFSAKNFISNALRPQVKMIELKLSQGAKPGHGGILPAAKNTAEIALIRNVKPGITVHSPTYHSAFNNPIEMMQFIKKLRDLSEGKPVGFKLCIGKKSEFFALCKAMIKTNIYPDFITVDGGEGGTGAAPPEFSNSVGMPLLDGLAFVHDALNGFGIRDKIKVICSGKILSSFHMLRALALGADSCNSARAMMMALGCIQALLCNTNKCPTGVATQDESLMMGLNVDDKKIRVANYHKNSIAAFIELMAASGVDSPSKLRREHISRRIFASEVKTYEEIYPSIPFNAFNTGNIDQRYRHEFESTNAEAWR
jgi:glutamate synthase domain-containing protein 2